MFALTALVLVLGLNLVSVKVFGEMEFWFALIKVVALVGFLLLGTYFVIFGTPVEGQQVGFSLIADNGGWLPNGLLPAIVVIQGVVFAYAGVELIGTTSGEAQNPEKVIPKAINTVVVRILVFYVGSVLLLSLLLPYSAYQAGVSPFVTFFGSIGFEGADAIMNMVVLTAALSSLNAGPVLHRPHPALDVHGRFRAEVRRPDEQGGRPLRRYRADRARHPAGRRPERGGARGRLRDRAERGVPRHPGELGHDRAVSAQAVVLGEEGSAAAAVFPDVRAPYTGYLVLVFLAGVLVLVGFDYPVGTWTVGSLAVIVPLLILGWFLCRNRITAIARSAPASPDSSR